MILKDISYVSTEYHTRSNVLPLGINDRFLVQLILLVLLLSQFSSVQFSRPIRSDSLHPHELQRARPPCPHLTLKKTQQLD